MEEKATEEMKKQALKYIRNNPVKKKILNNFLKLAIYSKTFLTPSGIKGMSTKEGRTFLFNRKARIGLLEGAILSNPLYVPNKEGNSLAYEDAIAGRYVGFDPRKEEIFPEIKPLSKGRLFAFHLDQIIGNDQNEKTPYGLLDILNIDHILQFSTPPLTSLCETGLLRETTYLEAYDRLGLLNRYERALCIQRIDDKKVYQVTPKGNTLIFLEKDGGEKKKKPEPKYQLEPLRA